MSVTNITFVQDGRAQTSKTTALVVEAGAVLRGHAYVSLGGVARSVKVSLRLEGRWICEWKPRPPAASSSPATTDPVVEGSMDASKTVASATAIVFEGTLLRGEHGMPASLSIPLSAPPSLATPTKTALALPSSPAIATATVPIHAKCSYVLVVKAESSSPDASLVVKTFSIPVIVMSPSGLRAAVLRNQPRPLLISNAQRLSVPSSIVSDAVKISPFSFSRPDPLDPTLRNNNNKSNYRPPADVRPIVDKDLLLYDIDMPRLHHYIGDQLPFTMAIRPKPQIASYTQVYSVTASLVSHIYFHLPSKLPTYQRPPSNAIAVRLHTETFAWDTIPDQEQSQQPTADAVPTLPTFNFPTSTQIDSLTTPRRFHFAIPDDESITCPSLPNTAQNKLPLEVLYMLRISVRIRTPTAVPEVLDRVQPISAVRVADADVLVLDVPIVLVSKGGHVHLWGIPRVPRGWRVGHFLETSSFLSSSSSANAQHSLPTNDTNDFDENDQEIVVKGHISSYHPDAKKIIANANAEITSKQSPTPTAQKRSTGLFSGIFTGGVTKPGPKVHPKFTAEELTKMAEDAMRIGYQKELREREVAVAAAAATAAVSSDSSTKDSDECRFDVVEAPNVSVEHDDDKSAVNEEPSSLQQKQQHDWEIRTHGVVANVSVSKGEAETGEEEEIQEEIDPACVDISSGSSNTIVLESDKQRQQQFEQEEQDYDYNQYHGNSRPSTSSIPSDIDFQMSAARNIVSNRKKVKNDSPAHSASDERTSDYESTAATAMIKQEDEEDEEEGDEDEKEDQMAKELDEGIDEFGRFLPMSDFSGHYRVLYPYLESLRTDEIRLAVGDVVYVYVSYVDGWAKARNETTGDEGFAPLHCLISDYNAYIEDGRPSIGKWFNTSLSHQVEHPNDWKYLCQRETRYNIVKEMMTRYIPASTGAVIEMPAMARMGLTQKRISSTWIDDEKCGHCYAQAAPEIQNIVAFAAAVAIAAVNASNVPGTVTYTAPSTVSTTSATATSSAAPTTTSAPVWTTDDSEPCTTDDAPANNTPVTSTTTTTGAPYVAPSPAANSPQATTNIYSGAESVGIAAAAAVVLSLFL
ncbi:hypothetical protein HK100_005735 [Physocladia obscura]|uniref:SH3 domain-containing protein n=1 Tax=Physocladia obscura TaxID=109957 RepID=A0AAD5XGC9_9FUNG|nr:hypothetical protein HK100_005735 [Physocladia obscura]